MDAPMIEKLTGTNTAVGARVTVADVTDLSFVQGAHSSVKIDGVESDCRSGLIRKRNDKAVYGCMKQARELKVDGCQILRASRPLTLALRFGPGSRMSGQVLSGKAMSIDIRHPSTGSAKAVRLTEGLNEIDIR